MPEQNLTSNKSFKIADNSKNPFEKFGQKPDEETPDEIIKNEESKLAEAAQELHVNLPEGNLPLGLKIVAVLTLVGGLSSLGSAFADIFTFQEFALKPYLLRLIGGGIFIFISYGIVKRQNWATWLYGAMVIVSLFIQWQVAVFPAIIVVYMYLNRKYFYLSVIDKFFKNLTEKISDSAKP
jgi:hypothetical protein